MGVPNQQHTGASAPKLTAFQGQPGAPGARRSSTPTDAPSTSPRPAPWFRSIRCAILRYCSRRASRECVDGFPQSDQSSSRHAKSLAGWAFELNVHFQPLVWSQQRGFTARLDKIKVQRHVLEVRPLHGPNGHLEGFVSGSASGVSGLTPCIIPESSRSIR